MKVWPPATDDRPAAGAAADHRPRPTADLAGWVLHEEKLLVETRFAGDSALYGRWRDRLWSEMDDTMHAPGHPRRDTADEEYVVTTIFGGDRDQYRACRDRLREELWQIMKVTKEA
jgi:hypothetical protein